MRRAAAVLAGAVLMFDVAVAVLWRRWCRAQGYAEQAAELELRSWP